MATYEPQRQSQRQAAIEPSKAALLFVDVQNFNCSVQGALYAHLTPDQLKGSDHKYWWARVDTCIHKWQQLQQACRAAGVEVMYTVIQNLTQDGRERSLDYKISGFNVPRGCWDAQVIDELAPLADEMVLAKTSSSVFNSTTLHYLLRNMDKKYLLLAGCVTDQCVDHAARDAADLGYMVTVATDCCATYSEERHVTALRAIQGYCRQRTVEELLPELNNSSLQQSQKSANAVGQDRLHQV